MMVGLVVVVGLLLSGVLIYKNASDKSAYQNASQAKGREMKQENSTPDMTTQNRVDTELDTASSNLDTDINSLTNDMNEVDQSLNDQPEDLTQ